MGQGSCDNIFNDTELTKDNSYKQWTHKHTTIALYIYIDSCTDILYYSTQIVHIMDCILLCTHVHSTGQLFTTTHICGAHTMLGSVVLLYIYSVVQSLYTSTVEVEPGARLA